MGISYSMCWEDPEILQNALNVTRDDSVLSIVSGGENIFALALQEPKKIVGIDIKNEQIYITKIKIEAIKEFQFEEFVKFIGFHPSKNRMQYYQKIRNNLSSEEQKFWDNHTKEIEMGIIHCGKLEQYLNLYRKYCLSFVFRKDKVKQFLKLKSLQDQKKFYDKNINNFMFRTTFKLFFSKKSLKKFRDEKYFKFKSKKEIGSHYLGRVEHSLTKVPIQKNYFMQYLLTGSVTYPFPNHPYLDKDNFIKLKSILNKNKIEFVNNSIENYISNSTKKSFSKFNLSDIFEAKSIKEYNSLLENISKIARDKSKICYWNNLLDRSSHQKIKGMKKDEILSKKLFLKDRVHFYSNFIVEVIN